MVEQLLWIEIVLKLAAGLALIAVPRTLARVFGLPSADDGFWPRLLGGMLVGLAAASAIESQFAARGGLGLAGSIAVNLAVAGMLGALLILGRGSATRRGRAFLWLVACALAVLSFVELAWAAEPAA